MLGTIVYVPLFVQGVLGKSATSSGVVVRRSCSPRSSRACSRGSGSRGRGRYKANAVVGPPCSPPDCCWSGGWTMDRRAARSPGTWSSPGVGLGLAMQVLRRRRPERRAVETMGRRRRCPVLALDRRHARRDVMGVIVERDCRAAAGAHEQVIHRLPPAPARRSRTRCIRRSSSPRSCAGRARARRLRRQGGTASRGFEPTLRGAGRGSRRRPGAGTATLTIKQAVADRLHAAPRLGLRRALGRQREAGGVLLRARVRLHAHGVRGPGDGRPRPRLVRARAGRHPLRRHVGAARGPRDREAPRRHGDGVKDIALTVPDATEAYRQAVQRGARGVAEPRRVEDEFGSLELSAIATYGDTIHTFVNRSDYARAVQARLRRRCRRTAGDAGVGLTNIDHVVGNVELGRMNHWVEFYERVFGMTEDDPLLRRGDLDRVLRADVEGDGGRRREDQVPDQRAGRGQAEEPDRRVPRLLRRARRAAHRDRDRRTSSTRSSAEGARHPLPRHAGHVLRGRRRTASARSTSRTPTCGGTGSSPTATTTATCCRSSRRPRRTGRPCSSR